jgi:hypothetical protein
MASDGVAGIAMRRQDGSYDGLLPAGRGRCGAS